MARCVIQDATLTSLWMETWSRDGRDYTSRKALVSTLGEPPMQISVAEEAYDEMLSHVGESGDLEIEIDARPGNRVRVFAHAIG